MTEIQNAAKIREAANQPTEQVADINRPENAPIPGAAPAPKLTTRERRRQMRMNQEDYQKIADQEYYVPQFIPKGGLVMFVGDSGIGKSWLAFALCSRILEENPESEVCFFDIDSGAVTTKPVVNVLFARHGRERFEYFSQNKVEEDEILPLLKEMATEDLRNQIIILDSFSSFTRGRINESADVAPFLKLCESLRNAGATVITIHHVKKPQTPEEIPLYAGSFMIKKAQDAMFSFTNKVTDDGKEINCHQVKSRGDYISRSFAMDDYTGVIVSDVDYISPEQDKAAKKQRAENWQEDKVVNLISRATGKGEPLLRLTLRDTIMEELNISRTKATKLIDRLEDGKAIFQEKAGLKNQCFMRVGYRNETKKIEAEEEPKNEDSNPF